MNLTDIFIKRPVLATVISLLIFVFGLRAFYSLPLREFPKMENTVITVSTGYAGANAQLIQSFITEPVEKAIASADGVNYISASSIESVSVVKAHINFNYDSDKAFTNIMSKVEEIKRQLPRESQDPVIRKDTGAQVALMYLSFNSSEMSPMQITDYISRVVQPKLETIQGVAQAQIMGEKSFAMRVWLNPQKMASLDITSADVANALRAKNFQTAAGKTKGKYISYNINASTDLHSMAEFKNIVIKSENNSPVHLKDIATVELGSQNYDSSVTFNGKQAIFVGITSTPSANPLTVIAKIRKSLPTIEGKFPPSLHGKIVYDAANYIQSSIREVIKTILVATAVVILVIFLFLGSLRSVFIPIITIPLSLVGVASFMFTLGYSINLLTLLAMVLAIGLVVDDSIVVVENIHRHIDEGMSPFDAAIKGAREIATPIIAMTITLAAVYLPIGFMGGITGTLFKQFAFTLAATVFISGVIAFSLSPMMCSKFLSSQLLQGSFVSFIDARFDRLKNIYRKRLHSVLNFRPVVLVFGVTVLVSCFFLFANTHKEMAPQEDQSALFLFGSAPENATFDYVSKFTNEYNKILSGIPQIQDYFIVNGMGAVNNVIAGIMLKPWGKRKLSQQELGPIVQQKLNQVPGLKTVVVPLPSLPTGDAGGMPIEFNITSTGDFKTLYRYSEKIAQAAQKSGFFMFVDNSLKFDKPMLQLTIDRDKAAALGVDLLDIGSTLSLSLSGQNINYFGLGGRSYEVIPQLSRQYREDPEQIRRLHVRTKSGAVIPLSTITKMVKSVQPNALSQFNQLNAATISGVAMPGKTIGDVLSFLQEQAKKVLPTGISYDYGGQSRRYIEESSSLTYTFFFALLVIFFVLAAQFESFCDPLIILVSVPMSICGALIPLNLGVATINIYTQVGLITLIGLISKHGILMVDFANKLQQLENLSIREAIERAASIRLRPILMTTSAMVLGVSPLLFASGAGATSRFDIGLVIATGMLVGTLFTLFVVPVMYTFLARKQSNAT